MTNSLFGTHAFGTPAFKKARHSDPDTSHQAATAVDSATLEERVYDIIKSFGMSGCISDEVCALIPNRPMSSVTTRYKALLEKGLIGDTGTRRQGNTGRYQRVMAAVATIPF